MKANFFYLYLLNIFIDSNSNADIQTLSQRVKKNKALFAWRRRDEFIL